MRKFGIKKKTRNNKQANPNPYIQIPPECSTPVLRTLDLDSNLHISISICSFTSISNSTEFSLFVFHSPKLWSLNQSVASLCTPMPRLKPWSHSQYAPHSPHLFHFMHLVNNQALPNFPLNSKKFPLCFLLKISGICPTPTLLLSTIPDSCQTSYPISPPHVLHHHPVLSALDTAENISVAPHQPQAEVWIPQPVLWSYMNWFPPCQPISIPR